MPKKTVSQIAVPDSMSPQEASTKIKKIVAEGNVAMPAGLMENLPKPGSKKETPWDNPEFTHINITGVGSFEDTEAFEMGSGKKHVFHGGTYMDFAWAAKDIGFGTFRIKKTTEGKVIIDTEGTGLEFFSRFMQQLIEQSQDEDKKGFARRKKKVTQ